MEFSVYQRGVKSTDRKRRVLISLAGLVGEVGSIVSAYKNKELLAPHDPSLKRELTEELGDALWYLTSIANVYGISLNTIAKHNLEKAKWLDKDGRVTKFDKEFSEDEQFPRQFDVDFTEKNIKSGNVVQVKISIKGVIVGDFLTDNSYDRDGYRYHDVFHLAYAAVLGWSPVIRALLKRKRKSNRKIDEIEDGARATAVEEAISIFIFNYAKAHNFFRDQNAIGFGLLRRVREIAGNLEVKDCTAKQWSKAISRGYEVFRELKENKGGIVSVDLDKADIWYQGRVEKKVAKNARSKRR